MDRPFSCVCRDTPKDYINPANNSRQPACVTNAHFRAREVGKQIRKLIDDEKRERYYRCIKSLALELRPAEGARFVDEDTRECAYQFLKVLAIELSPNPGSVCLTSHQKQQDDSDA